MRDIRFISAAPTVSTSAYASGDLVGTKLTFAYNAAGSNPTGMLLSAKIDDLAKQAVAMDLVLFSADPTGTTFTDNAAFDIADADLSKVCGVINFATTDQFSFNDNAISFKRDINMPLSASTVYGALVARATPTYAAGTDVNVTLAIACD